jgi:hypothetical protein
LPACTGALAVPCVTPPDWVPLDEDVAPGVLLSVDSVVAQP